MVSSVDFGTKEAKDNGKFNVFICYSLAHNETQYLIFLRNVAAGAEQHRGSPRINPKQSLCLYLDKAPNFVKETKTNPCNPYGKV